MTLREHPVTVELDLGTATSEEVTSKTRGVPLLADRWKITCGQVTLIPEVKSDSRPTVLRVGLSTLKKKKGFSLDLGRGRLWLYELPENAL